MSKQSLVDHAVKQCYEEYSKSLSGHNVGYGCHNYRTPKEYTIAWFSVWWDDVKMIELTRAIEKAEAINE